MILPAASRDRSRLIKSPPCSGSHQSFAFASLCSSCFRARAIAATQSEVNMLNVCSPSADEQKEITAALGRIPRQPLFSQDFEVDRGRSTLDEPPPHSFRAAALRRFLPIPRFASWVRIRREFSVQAVFSTVQYSFSSDGKKYV